jgi:hypothetical protein
VNLALGQIYLNKDLSLIFRSDIAAAIVLTVIGCFKGAAILVGLATAIELVASVINGKKTNT